MAQNPLQPLNSQKFNYGTTPQQAVAEQNQTFFAYFDGVGGTGPEYIDGTAYFIKYLIDTKGNVVNPEPFTVIDSPQAVGLYNLVDNFEVGKNATVKLIEPNPTIDTIPNSEILQGTHRIAHVGRIVPILVTENGENAQNYITTMSFGPLTTYNTNITVANATARFQKQSSQDTFNQTSYSDLPFLNFLSGGDPNVWDNANSINKLIQSSSLKTATRIRFKIGLYIEAGWDSGGTYRENYITIRVVRNNTEVVFESGMTNAIGISTISNGASGTWSSGFSEWLDYDQDDTFKVQAKVSNGNADNQIRIKGNDDGRANSVFYVYQDIPAGTVFEGEQQVLLTEGVNAVESDYFDGLVNSYNSNNGGFTNLTMTPPFYPIYESGLIQNLDPTSKEFGFSEIKIPFSDIKPGDFIRFNYDKTRIHTIYNIRVLSYGDQISTLILSIFPAVSNLGTDYANSLQYLSTLNHFIIYRVINDGVYVTLDVAKDAPGGAYSGILQPEFVSQELVDNYDKIITNLTEREIIQ